MPVQESQSVRRITNLQVREIFVFTLFSLLSIFVYVWSKIVRFVGVFLMF